jgi:hypothetical protein
MGQHCFKDINVPLLDGMVEYSAPGIILFQRRGLLFQKERNYVGIATPSSVDEWSAAFRTVLVDVGSTP